MSISEAVAISDYQSETDHLGDFEYVIGTETVDEI